MALIIKLAYIQFLFEKVKFSLYRNSIDCSASFIRVCHAVQTLKMPYVKQSNVLLRIVKMWLSSSLHSEVPHAVRQSKTYCGQPLLSYNGFVYLQYTITHSLSHQHTFAPTHSSPRLHHTMSRYLARLWHHHHDVSCHGRMHRYLLSSPLLVPSAPRTSEPWEDALHGGPLEVCRALI